MGYGYLSDRDTSISGANRYKYVLNMDDDIFQLLMLNLIGN